MESVVNDQIKVLKESLEKQIKDFLSKAVRRDGGDFKVISVQYDGRGLPNMLKGTVDIKSGSESKTESMFWNIHGKAQSQLQQLDLVTEAPYKP